MSAHIVTQMHAGHIKSRADIIKTLQDLGYTLPRIGKDYLTIMDASGNRTRLKGTLYVADFQAEQWLALEAEKNIIIDVPDLVKATEAEQALQKAIHSTALYNKSYYNPPQITAALASINMEQKKDKNYAKNTTRNSSRPRSFSSKRKLTGNSNIRKFPSYRKHAKRINTYTSRHENFSRKSRGYGGISNKNNQLYTRVGRIHKGRTVSFTGNVVKRDRRQHSTFRRYDGAYPRANQFFQARPRRNQAKNVLSLQEEFRIESQARKVLWDEQLAKINNVTLSVFDFKKLRQEIGQQAKLLAEMHTIMAIGNTLQKLQAFKGFNFPSNDEAIKKHLTIIRDIKNMTQDIVAKQTVNAVGNVLMQEQARIESQARKAWWDNKIATINNAILPAFNFKELRQEIGQQASLLAERHTIMNIGNTLQKLQAFKNFNFPSNEAVIKEHLTIIQDIKSMTQDIVARQTINAVGHALMQEQAKILESQKTIESPVPQVIDSATQQITHTGKVIKPVKQVIKQTSFLTAMQEKKIINLESNDFKYILNKIHQELIRVIQCNSKNIVNTENYANTIQKQESVDNKLVRHDENYNDSSEDMFSP